MRERRGDGPPPSAEDRARMRRMHSERGGGGPGRGRPGGQSWESLFGGEYVVFALRDARPVPRVVRTGLTDLDYSEVREGLDEGEMVLVLPSSGLVAEQERLRQLYERITGGGLPGLRSSGR